MYIDRINNKKQGGKGGETKEPSKNLSRSLEKQKKNNCRFPTQILFL